MAHPLELAEPNVIDEELIRTCITTVEEIAIPEDKKREMKTETELHHVQVTSPALVKKFCCWKTVSKRAGKQIQRRLQTASACASDFNCTGAQHSRTLAHS